MTPGSGLARSLGEAVVEGLGRVAGRLRESTREPVDVLESDEEFLVVVDAPGAAVEDVSVRYDEGTVRIRVDRRREEREGFELRYPGRGLGIDAVAQLPDDAAVDAAEARAVLRDTGTLWVFFPKVPAAEQSSAATDTAAAAGADDAADTGVGDDGETPDGADTETVDEA